MHPTGESGNVMRKLGCLYRFFPAGDARRWASRGAEAMIMKKNQIAASCLFALCLQTACSVSYEPKRASGVPQQAIWAGGADGGAWVLCEVRNPEGTRYYCRVFDDFSGKEMVSGEYGLRKVEWNREQHKLIYSEVGEFRQELKFNSFDGSRISLTDSLILLPLENASSGC